MFERLCEFVVRHLLARGDIELDGFRTWDIRVYDARVFKEILLSGSLGLGESYMRGWWNAERVDEFIEHILSAHLDRIAAWSPVELIARLKAKIRNDGAKECTFRIGEAHYDIGNDLYAAMLDPRMVYSCGYWAGGIYDLGAAQEAKLDLVCRKLGLKPGQRILDIGCGWGGLLKFAVERYGVSGVGITVSKEQAELARTLCTGLPIEVRLTDYRDVDERFDHIASLGMFEHVERENYCAYFKMARRCLKPSGLFLLHTIGKYRSGETDPWIRRRIFPLGMNPTPRDIERNARGILEILDWHRFGANHYDLTLMAWHRNFTDAWKTLKARYAGKAGGMFERMWRYYLLACAGAFRAQTLSVWQIVFAAEKTSYTPVR